MESRDVISSLPAGWREEVSALAAEAEFRSYPRTPVLSREAAGVTHVQRGRVEAGKVMEALPWLYDLYHGQFRELGREVFGDLDCAADDRYGVVLNVQQGPEMRFECHVDSNPVTGLLFLTTSSDGELVVSCNPDATGIDQPEEDCFLIPPQEGKIIFFDGKTYPHYARPCKGTRIAAVMNFYTQADPESNRPAILNRHRFGDE